MSKFVKRLSLSVISFLPLGLNATDFHVINEGVSPKQIRISYTIKDGTDAIVFQDDWIVGMLASHESKRKSNVNFDAVPSTFTPHQFTVQVTVGQDTKPIVSNLQFNDDTILKGNIHGIVVKINSEPVNPFQQKLLLSLGYIPPVQVYATLDKDGVTPYVK